MVKFSFIEKESYIPIAQIDSDDKLNKEVLFLDPDINSKDEDFNYEKEAVNYSKYIVLFFKYPTFSPITLLLKLLFNM